MAEKKLEKKKTIGCVFGLLQLVCLMPLWYVLLYHALLGANVPAFVWWIYYTYVPLGFVLRGAQTIASALFDVEDG